MSKEELTAEFYEQNKIEINALAKSLYGLSFEVDYGKTEILMVFDTDFGKIGIIKAML